MFNFKAYFWGNDIYINEKYRYSSNEILIAYLNDRRVKYILESDYPEIKKLSRWFCQPPLLMCSLLCFMRLNF